MVLPALITVSEQHLINNNKQQQKTVQYGSYYCIQLYCFIKCCTVQFYGQICAILLDKFRFLDTPAVVQLSASLTPRFSRNFMLNFILC